MNDYLELSHTLPCGCALKMRSCTKFPVTTGDPVKYHGELLSFWLQDHSARHQCALVTEENPCGVAPRVLKESK